MLFLFWLYFLLLSGAGLTVLYLAILAVAGRFGAER